VRCAVASAVRAVLHEARIIAGLEGMSDDPALSQALGDLDLYTLEEDADAATEYLGGLLRPPEIPLE
jgi:hypothetical protein